MKNRVNWGNGFTFKPQNGKMTIVIAKQYKKVE